MMHNLTIKTKIMGAFALVLAIVALLGGFSIYEMAGIDRNSTDIAKNWMPGIRDVGVLNAGISEFRIAEGTYILSTSDAERGEAEASMADAAAEIEEARSTYEGLISSEEARSTYQAFSSQWDAYLAADEELLALSRQNRKEEATQIFKGKSKEAFGQAMAKLDELVALNVKGGEAASAAGDEGYRFGRTVIVGGLVLSLLGAAALAWLIVRNVSALITLMTAAMTRLGQGDKTIEVPGLSRHDEIGGMAKALQVFKDTAIEAERLAAQQAAEQEARPRRAASIEALTTTFDREAAAVVKAVSAAATEMRETAGSMTETAKDTALKATAVAAASDQASTNVQTVASATEELSSSVAEISRQVSESSRIAGDAVAQAGKSGELVKTLAEAAQRIGNVVGLINDIANQTAKATEEIGAQIASIQQATGETVQAIEGIAGVISRVNEIAATITAAVEEQQAATQEIARNVQQAALGTQDVSVNIASVTESAQHSGFTATQFLAAAADLAKQSESMRSQVETFIAGIKAA